MNRSQPATPVVAARAIFFLNAAIWIAIGVASLLRVSSGNVGLFTMAIIIVLMVVNAGAMLFAGIIIDKSKWTWYFGIALLTVNIVLTFTDQFGFLDFATLAIDACLLAVLLVQRAQFIPG